MHIGFYCSGWPVNQFPNGIVTYVHSLRKELLEQGHRVSVFASQIGNSNTDAGIHLVTTPTARKFSGKLARLLRIDQQEVFEWGKAIAKKVNAVHTADPLDAFEMEESFGWCGDVQLSVPIPVIVKLHGPEFLTQIAAYGQPELAAVRVRKEGEGLRKIRAIVSPAACTLQRTVEHYALRPQIEQVIPNPVVVDPEMEEWQFDTCDKKTLLFVGQFSKVKGGDIMLLAFQRLLERDPNLKLVFVGPDRGIPGTDQSSTSFREFQDSLFTDAAIRKIRYMGQIPRNDVFGLRTSSAVTIVVSRWENQPNTALEAMAQGCPVVAFNSGGIGEIIHHGTTGLLARPGDIEDLCAQIMSVLSDPAGAARMGSNAREYVLRRHSVQRVASEALHVYARAVSLADTATRGIIGSKQ